MAVNPVPGASFARRPTGEPRIDQGVDYYGSGNVLAIASGTIADVAQASWGWAVYEIFDAPLCVPSGRCYRAGYYAERDPLVHRGDVVAAGDPVMTGSLFGYEIGFLDPTGAHYGAGSPPHLYGGFGDLTQPTQEGLDYANIVCSLGGPCDSKLKDVSPANPGQGGAPGVGPAPGPPLPAGPRGECPPGYSRDGNTCNPSGTLFPTTPPPPSSGGDGSGKTDSCGGCAAGMVCAPDTWYCKSFGGTNCKGCIKKDTCGLGGLGCLGSWFGNELSSWAQRLGLILLGALLLTLGVYLLGKEATT